MNRTIDERFPQRARARLREIGMDITELSRLLGNKTHTGVAMALSTTHPRAVSWKKLEQMAAAMECRPEWLARGEGVAPQRPAKPALQLRVIREEGGTRTDTLGARCRLARIELDLSQADFARRLTNRDFTIGRQGVNKIELDQVVDPGSKTMIRYQEITGYSVRWLVTGRGEPKAASGTSAPAPADINIRAMGLALGALREAETVPAVASMPDEARAAMLLGFYRRLS